MDKSENGKVIDLYEEGVFYHAYDEDAGLLARLTGYKLVYTKWHGKRRGRCGFPMEASGKMIELFRKHGICGKIHTQDGSIKDLTDVYKQDMEGKAISNDHDNDAQAGVLTLSLVDGR